MEEEYFAWMSDLVRCPSTKVFLLEFLNRIPFVAIMEEDQNRIDDGVDLRYRFGSDAGYSDELIKDYLFSRGSCCSVLEMLVALSIRCNMCNPIEYKQHDTHRWFWMLIDNMGLSDVTEQSDPRYIYDCVNRMMYREYDQNGTNGGLFFVIDDNTMRDTEIWYQMHKYMNSIA